MPLTCSSWEAALIRRCRKGSNRRCAGHADIVQFDFADRFTNLAVKSVGAAAWVHAHLNVDKVQYVLKVEDYMTNSFAKIDEAVKRVAGSREPKTLLRWRHDFRWHASGARWTVGLSQEALSIRDLPGRVCWGAVLAQPICSEDFGTKGITGTGSQRPLPH